MKILLVKLKNLCTSACLKLNYCTAKHKPKLSLHGKPFFLFPEVLKRWSFQKNRAGIWSFLYYRERSCFFFPKIWSYTLERKWKMIFLKKNTRKYDIFIKLSEKMVFSKSATLGHDLSCIIWKDGIFFQKRDIFSLGRKREMTFLKKYMNIWYFLCTRTSVTNVVSDPSAKKSQGWFYPTKIHLKVIDILDWHPGKSSSNALYFNGDLYRRFYVLLSSEKKNTKLNI